MDRLTRAQHSIGLTMGDPSGIGPEICLKTLAAPSSTRLPRCVLYGDVVHLHRLAQQLNLPHNPDDWVDTGSLGPYDMATANAAAGQAAYQAIVRATEDAKHGHLAALVTAPISKKALHLAGHLWPGHTELLAHLVNPLEPPPVRMMLVNPQLAVVLDSVHLPLREAIDRLSTAQLVQTIQIAHKAAKERLKLDNPRIAVAALNPHASEDGAFGHEESAVLTPAIELAKALVPDISVSGPWPADTVFMRAQRLASPAQDFDVVICLYHDQGLIPIKLNGLDQGVNITIGLPFIRTSVDHGTAFDIVGRGLASPRSLQSALNLATTWLS